MTTSHHSHTPHAERDEFRTPPWLYAWACNEWGPHTIDLAATPDNALCSEFYTKQDNALTQPWGDGGPLSQAWCNPPYSDLNPWLERATSMPGDFPSVTMLLPAPQGASWISYLEHASELVFIVGRVSFIRPNGKPATGNTGGSIFARFVPKVRRRLPRFIERDTMLESMK